MAQCLEGPEPKQRTERTPKRPLQLPTERFRWLALEALLYESEVNAEQVSTAGEKELFLSMSMSLGRGVRIIALL